MNGSRASILCTAATVSTSHIRAIRAILISAVLLLTSASTVALAQDDGTSDSAVQGPIFPVPSTSGVLGIKNSGAINEISAFLQVASVSPWTDLQASGNLSLSSGGSYAATLYLSGADYSRLDITMDSGTRSLRSYGSSGEFHSELGDQTNLLPVTSRTAIIALPLLWTDSIHSPNVSLFDNGLVQIGSQALHRVTAEYTLNTGPYMTGNPTIATDLYFDPATHLLLYSVDAQFFANSGDQVFLRVTNYSGYQPFNGFVMPSNIGQSLNGQPQWTFQLTQVTVNSNLPLDTFSF